MEQRNLWRHIQRKMRIRNPNDGGLSSNDHRGKNKRTGIQTIPSSISAE